MIFKIQIVIEGNEFYPNNALSGIQTNYLIISSFNPGDKPRLDSDIILNYGYLILWHPFKFATAKYLEYYEKDMVEFIENYYSYFVEFKAQKIEFYLECYYEGQCNFEIFNPELLLRISKLGISLPISVYKLEPEKYNNWELEINEVWKNIDLIEIT